jgi:CRP-like cAMP-binding protein
MFRFGKRKEPPSTELPDLLQKISGLEMEIERLEALEQSWAESGGSEGDATSSLTKNLRRALAQEDLAKKRPELDRLRLRALTLEMQAEQRANPRQTKLALSGGIAPRTNPVSEPKLLSAPQPVSPPALPPAEEPPQLIALEGPNVIDDSVSASAAPAPLAEIGEPIPALDHWLFAGLEAEQLTPLLNASREVSFHPGQVLFREGDPPDGVYIVQTGSVQIAARDKRGRLVVTAASAGTVIGDLGVIDGQPRAAVATATETGAAYFLPAGELLAVLNDSPSVSTRLLTILVHKVRQTNASIMSASGAPVAATGQAGAPPRERSSERLKNQARDETRKYLEAALPLVQSLETEYRRWIDLTTAGSSLLQRSRDSEGRLTSVYLWRVAPDTKTFSLLKPPKTARDFHDAMVLCLAARESAARLFRDATSRPTNQSVPGIKEANRRMAAAEEHWARAQAARKVLEADGAGSPTWQIPVGSSPSSPRKETPLIRPIRGVLPRAGEQADILRALGQSLDDLGADAGIEIKGHESFVSVSWLSEGPWGAQRSYQEQGLESLRTRARALRKGSTDGTPSGALAEIFRTIGQELDDEGIEVTGIFQEEGGFRVSGIRSGIYQTSLWYLSDIHELSEQRRATRANPRADQADGAAPLVVSGPTRR